MEDIYARAEALLLDPAPWQQPGALGGLGALGCAASCAALGLTLGWERESSEQSQPSGQPSGQPRATGASRARAPRGNAATVVFDLAALGVNTRLPTGSIPVDEIASVTTGSATPHTARRRPPPWPLSRALVYPPSLP